MFPGIPLYKLNFNLFMIFHSILRQHAWLCWLQESNRAFYAGSREEVEFHEIILFLLLINFEDSSTFQDHLRKSVANKLK